MNCTVYAAQLLSEFCINYIRFEDFPEQTLRFFFTLTDIFRHSDEIIEHWENGVRDSVETFGDETWMALEQVGPRDFKRVMYFQNW